MKRISTSWIHSGLAVFLAGPVLAIEAPPDDALPPPPLQGSASALEVFPGTLPPDTAATQSSDAFLGLVTAALPQLLADHLNIAPQEGVVVTAVVPDGPAAQAGIVVNDVLTHIAGKSVTCCSKLSEYIRSQKPGDLVEVKLIHKGKPAEVSVKVGDRPTDAVALEAGPLDQLNLGGMSPEQAAQIRGLIERNLQAMQSQELPQIDGMPSMADTMREMQERMNRSMSGAIPAEPQTTPAPRFQMQSNATIKIMDGRGCVELRSENGGKAITVRDAEHQVIWEGPWNTEEEKAAAPDEVRSRIDQLHLNDSFAENGFRMKLRSNIFGR